MLTSGFNWSGLLFLYVLHTPAIHWSVVVGIIVFEGPFLTQESNFSAENVKLKSQML